MTELTKQTTIYLGQIFRTDRGYLECAAVDENNQRCEDWTEVLLAELTDDDVEHLQNALHNF